jgi:ABC-2 type transport system permease protein
VKPRALAYAELTRIQFRTALAYRANYLIGFVGVLVQIYLLRTVWTSVYDGRPSVDGVTLETAVVYSTLAVVQYALFVPYNFSQIPQRVRDGKVAMDLLRPVGFVNQAIAGQTGVVLALLPLAALSLPFAVLLGGIRPPAGAGATLGYVVSLVLAYVVTTQLSVVVGCLAFWTIEVNGIYMIYRTVAQFLSGALVPLWVMPDWLVTTVHLLPFQATAYAPTAIYVGQLRGGDMLAAIGVQAMWIVLLAVLAWWVWSRTIHRVVVQGG